jgi:hypothetical protein
MKLTLKNYKLTKIKLLVKKNKLLVFCNFFNAITKEFVQLKQKMLKKQVKFFNTNSFLICYLLKNSIYLNLKNLNFGPIALLRINKLKFFFEIISNLITTNKNKLYFFCCIFNKKIYNFKFFLGLKTLKFVSNIKIFYFYLKKYIAIVFVSSFFFKKFRNNVI